MSFINVVYDVKIYIYAYNVTQRDGFRQIYNEAIVAIRNVLNASKTSYAQNTEYDKLVTRNISV